MLNGAIDLLVAPLQLSGADNGRYRAGLSAVLFRQLCIMPSLYSLIVRCPDRMLPPALAVSILLGVVGSASAQSTGQSTQAGRPTDSSGGTTQKQREREREKARQDGDEDTAVTARRPYRAVFGGASTQPELTKTLDLTAAVGEAYDQNLLGDISSPDSGAPQDGGFYTSLVGDLTFNRRGTRFQAVATGGTNARYYTDLHEFFASDYHVAAGFTARPTRRSQFRGNQAFSYAPVYLLGLFASALPPAIGEVRPPSTDYAGSDDRSYTNSTSGGLTRIMGPRAVLSLTGDLRLTHYLDSTVRGSGFRDLGGGGSYVYTLHPDADFRVGYIYRSAHYDSAVQALAPTPAEHNIDLGIDYHRALSATRRTGFTFRGGSSIVNSPLPTNTQVSVRQVRMIADGSVVRQFAETWQLVGAYRRGTGFVEGLSRPAFSDAWTVSANGFMSRRTDFFTSVSYSSGEALQVGSSQNFNTYNATARLRTGLNRHWAFTAEYIYYFYDFSKTILLVPGRGTGVQAQHLSRRPDALGAPQAPVVASASSRSS